MLPVASDSEASEWASSSYTRRVLGSNDVCIQHAADVYAIAVHDVVDVSVRRVHDRSMPKPEVRLIFRVEGGEAGMYFGKESRLL